MKKILVKEVSSKGHDEWDFDADEALEYIKEATGDGKWLFVNGTFANPTQVTLDDLVEAKEVLLTNALVGGNVN